MAAVDETGLDPAEPSGRAIDSRLLPSGTGYVSCRDVGAYELADYPALMDRALLAVRDAERLIVDLRWGSQPRSWPNLHRRPRFSTDDCWPSCVLGFFLEATLPTPARRERVHTGWSEEGWSLYGESLQLRAGEPLEPIRQPPFFVQQRYGGTRFGDLAVHHGRLAVLVDDDSIGWLDDGLAALQLRGRAVVVHETAGNPRPRGAPLRVRGGVQLQTRSYGLIAPDGGPAPQPDRTLAKRADPDDAVAVAEELLAAPAFAGHPVASAGARRTRIAAPPRSDPVDAPALAGDARDGALEDVECVARVLSPP